MTNDWIATDAKYKQILFPYMNGQEFNSTFDFSPTRYAINCGDMSEEAAAGYPLAMGRVRELDYGQS